MTTTLENVRGLAGSIEARAAQVEAARTLTPDVVEDLREAGCFRMWVPRSLGGDELSVPEVMQVIEALSQADGSTGWCIAIAAQAMFGLGPYPDEVLAKLFEPPDLLAAGVNFPSGTAERVDGGYVVTGEWRCASGCLHAQILGVTCLVTVDGKPQMLEDGTPELVSVVLWPAEVEILDTWHVTGLRGTGSHDLRVSACHVSDERISDLSAEVVRTEPVYRVPGLGIIALTTSAVAFGIARGALDDVVALAGLGHQRTFAPRPLADDLLVRDGLGRLDAALSAADALLHRAAERAWQKALIDEPLSPIERTRLRAAGAEVVALCRRVTEGAFDLAGTKAISDRHPLQRRVRDVLVVGQHAGVSPGAHRDVGSLLVGKDIDPRCLA